MSTDSLPHPTLLRAAAHGAPGELLAQDVTFASPFAEYHGRADVAHLFGLIGRVLCEPTITGAASDGTFVYTSLRGSAAGQPIEGVVRERHDGDGRLVHGTLFLRPYRSLRAAMDAMGRLLAESPLPGAR